MKVIIMPIAAPPRDIASDVAAYTSHLEALQEVFNRHTRQIGLGVVLDTSTAVEMAKRGRGLASVIRFAERKDDTGVLHEAQLMTALDAVGEMLTSPLRNGLILGAMQSGKTTTSLALQLAGPIIYLLTGRTIYPIYLITSQTSQEDQTKLELERFLELYGEIDVRVDDEHHCTLIEYIRNTAVDPHFAFSPTINTYRGRVLGGALPDPTIIGPQLEDFVQRRVRGESLKRVAGICRAANEQGFSPVLIIDEPQFGASDRFVMKNGEEERRPCVLLQMFQQINEALGADAGEHTFVGLSATPFELHDLSAVWEVPQYLTSNYSGYNFFGGEVIDGTTKVPAPKTITLGTLAAELHIPFLSNISMAVYDGSPARFRTWANKNGFSGSQDEYRVLVEQALRAAILKIVHDANGRPIGICVRLLNNNARSHQLLQKLALDPKTIEVVEYFGGDHRGESVKRALSRRSHRALPFLVAVTNRARMGDAFPVDVEWFFEFAQKAADLNALLQGLLGRACGYGKHSTVVMSEENLSILGAYIRTDGGFVYTTSRHSNVFGERRRGAPTSLIRIRAEWDDPVVRQFFKRLSSEVVDPIVFQDRPTLGAKRAPAGEFRTGPILRIAQEVGLFEHLEEESVRLKLLPTYPAFRIARAADKVRKSGTGELLTYQLDDKGDCRFTFRATTGQHGGMRSRGLGDADAADRAKAGDKLEPQINMQKFDPATGAAIVDRTTNGNWAAVMITLPIVNPVQEVRAGDVAYPKQTSPFSSLMSEEENDRAGYVNEDAD
jgi:hypothetical protein